MVGKNINRQLAQETFEYGQHEIRIEIRLKYDNAWSHQNILNYNVTLHNSPEVHYIRTVEVEAIKDGTIELQNDTIVVLDEERERSTLFGGTKVRHRVINIREHIAETARPVFEELDELYTYTTEGESIDIDVATHEVKSETSWVEVEDEIDRLSREIEALSGGDG